MANLLHPDIRRMHWLRLETRAITARLAALEAQKAIRPRDGYEGVETSHLLARKQQAEPRAAKR